MRRALLAAAGVAGRLAPNGERVTDMHGGLCVVALGGANDDILAYDNGKPFVLTLSN